MDWVKRMNQVIDYVEDHLSDEINEKEISKITACSFSLLQGSFAQITGISLSEYVRRRKLTCAAYDLQNTDEKVIDIALKYGYQSSGVWQRINHEFLPQSKYKKSGLPTIEKYILWDDVADICNVEIWIPVALK